ncbi:class I SAM-dependent methyltransferase [Devosia sp. 2618]|uniref:class I SAM-dependent methyltransferase n=1 Tax=Devosia sp. 2618 TaxID=3156454 RepID=UPI0033932DA0
MTRNLFQRPNLYDLSTGERIGAAFMHPSDMCATDRIMLYALVRGLRPERVLEIGVRWGGGARIIASALEDNSFGVAVGLDPDGEPFSIPDRHLHGRYRRLSGYSPQDTGAAIDLLGGAPDFVLIDALHTHDAAQADFMGVLTYIGNDAHILFHDAYHQGIASAVQGVLDVDDTLVDMGFITRNPEVGSPVSYQGLRLVRRGGVDFRAHINQAYSDAGQVPPPIHPALRNYDSFANRIGMGADLAEVEKVMAESAE